MTRDGTEDTMTTKADRQASTAASSKPAQTNTDALREHRQTILRAVHFDNPDYIPMIFHINEACWHHYPPDALKELMASHPFLFPQFDGNLAGLTFILKR